MKIIINAEDLKELLSYKFDINKVTIVADDIIIDGTPKEQPIPTANIPVIQTDYTYTTMPHHTVDPTTTATPYPGTAPQIWSTSGENMTVDQNGNARLTKEIG